MDNNFAIIGNGSWATALAKMLTHNNLVVNWWMRNEEAKEHFESHHHNLHYLSSVNFAPDSIRPSTDLNNVIQHSKNIIISVPSAYLQPLLLQLSQDAFQNKNIISAVKGILPNHHQLLNDFLYDHFHFQKENYFAISGPCHAEEVAQERLSYLTFSGENMEQTAMIAKNFNTPYIQTSSNNDIYGTQYAAVLKNIYALGAGIAHGLGYGDNFLSVYITNCYREMYEFLKHHFEKNCIEKKCPDFHTSAYLGDLLVTCYSPHSRNRRFGSLLGKGYSIQAASAEMSMVAEGYNAAKGMHEIAQEHQIPLPICELIYDMLWNQKNLTFTFKKMESLLS